KKYYVRNYFTGVAHIDVNRRISRVAAQQELGLLSKRRTRSGRSHSDCPDFVGTNLKFGMKKISSGRIISAFGMLIFSVFLTSCAHLHKSAATNSSAADLSRRSQAEAETVVLPQSVPDPIEPLNRVMWGFNKALMTDVIKPTSKVYRFAVAKPIRTGIENFGKNLTYPGRLINNLLQGKWTGARDESYRFACNTTVGIAGIFDPATKWKIPKSDADFGQTFGQWGWKPHCFLMLPVFGPSNERDTLGLAADTAANPLLYIAPYDFKAS